MEKKKNHLWVCLEKDKKVLFIFLLFFISLTSAFTPSQFDFDYPTSTNYSLVNTNYSTTSGNAILWNGNAWSDTRWLNIDGSNANQPISIGAYTFTAGTIKPNSNNNRDLGTSITNYKDLYLLGKLISGSNEVSVAQMSTAFIHTTNNNQAHSDYLKNNADDTTNSSLTATGNITASYFIGNGSSLTSVCLSNGTNCVGGAETDPFWTANYTAFNSTWSNMTNSSYRLNDNNTFYGNISTDGNITAIYYFGNGSRLTNLPNPFNQVLNTTSNVAFNQINLNNTLTLNHSGLTTLSTGLVNFLGNFAGTTYYMLNFMPNITTGNPSMFQVSPNIATNVTTTYGINFQPTYASNVIHKFTGINIIYPTHTDGFADFLSLIDESTTRTYVNTKGKIDINTISIGEALGLLNVGGGEPDYEENMITLTGGIPTEIGITLSPIQRGIKFVGFENKGTNSTIEAIHMSGGDINIDDDGSFIKMGEDQDALIRFDGTNLNINMTTNGALTIYNTTGLGKIRALEYATSTPFDSVYDPSVSKYIDLLPTPENILDENGKIIIGGLRNAQQVWLEKDTSNCWKVGTGEFWYSYDIVGTNQKHYSYSKINLTENKDLIKEQYVEIMKEECGRKEVNVTLIDTQAFENTIMISELNQKVSSLQNELNRIKTCTANSLDYRAYQVCVGVSL